jgi:2-keto-4-pentenoate hydratase/2-oxohepta-3-ene-1,7-dioic acid hydratase in catechol pathway
MRFARFVYQGEAVFGLVDGEQIVPLRGSPFERWDAAGAALPLAQVRLLVPVVPPTFYAIGMNYAEHARHAAQLRGLAPALPTRPEPGYRANNALIAHGESIVLPPETQAVQYEGELVVVIGRRAKHLSEEQALSCVLGYTIGNDISERHWQKIDRTFWRAKNSDTFKPMGPWIDTDVQLDALRTTVRVNGRTVNEFATNTMLFGIARFIAEMTRYLTLYPGDVIWMGTEGASSDLHAGDRVEVEINQIGVLSNPVVAAAAPGPADLGSSAHGS